MDSWPLREEVLRTEKVMQCCPRGSAWVCCRHSARTPSWRWRTRNTCRKCKLRSFPAFSGGKCGKQNCFIINYRVWGLHFSDLCWEWEWGYVGGGSMGKGYNQKGLLFCSPHSPALPPWKIKNLNKTSLKGLQNWLTLHWLLGQGTGLGWFLSRADLLRLFQILQQSRTTHVSWLVCFFF